MSARYIHSSNIHNLAAPREIVPIVMQIVNPASVLDVGCGNGTWLKAFEEAGVTDYLGIDGSEYTQDFFIDKEKYQRSNLDSGFDLKRKFGLVICLEVAEHLSEASADTLVESIVRHGNTILFSAAIPGQGGQYHVNEQWPQYWREKFLARGLYFHDVIRPRIWQNAAVEPWYRQNIFLITAQPSDHKPMFPVVHPDIYLSALRVKDEMIESMESGKQGVRLSFGIFIRSLLYKLKSIFRS